MISIPLMYILFVIVIILQVMTLASILSKKLKAIENSISRNNIEVQQSKPRNYEEPIVQNTLQYSQPPIVAKNPVPISKPNTVKDNQNMDNEEVLFVKQIKLDKRSQVIDMDVQLNNKNQ
ncbi:MAG: hypothetical protein RIN55_10825 [Tissierellaceae bacterium]|nr:hypothetical protein [Tissierellaceae bacterium]